MAAPGQQRAVVGMAGIGQILSSAKAWNSFRRRTALGRFAPLTYQAELGGGLVPSRQRKAGCQGSGMVPITTVHHGHPA